MTIEGNQRPKPEVIATLTSYLELGVKFEDPPKVRLAIKPQVIGDEKGEVGARDIAITTAMQCYAPGTAKLKPRVEESQQAIGDSTLNAGHLTTREHAQFTFHLDGISRDVTERVLHFTPFYHSEQQSQRYVEAKAGNYEVPAGLTTEQRDLYVGAAEYMNNMYFELLGELHPEVERRVREMNPAGGWRVPETAKRLNSKVDKTCQEVARYVLPIAQKTVMYHSLSELSLLRLFRASQMDNFTDEARYVVAKMIQEVAQVDSSILSELDKPLPAYRHPIFRDQMPDQKWHFDVMLEGKDSLLISTSENPARGLVRAVRNVTGAFVEEIDDKELLNLLMNPESNALLSDVYEAGMFDPFTACLRQVSVTFMTKLSHTAESQRQRQRRTPGATPTVDVQYVGTPDYITPLVIRENTDLRAKYDEIMGNIYRNVEACMEVGVPQESALKLLPNAHAIRTVETGDLFDWLHRFKQRLCFLAQEEICFISIDQVEQLLEILPEAEKMLRPPCAVAYDAGTGKCPEGARWCGKAVWKMKVEQFKKERLI